MTFDQLDEIEHLRFTRRKYVEALSKFAILGRSGPVGISFDGTYVRDDQDEELYRVVNELVRDLYTNRLAALDDQLRAHGVQVP